MKESLRQNLSARVVIALAVLGLGVILAACANSALSSDSISGALAAPTVDAGPAATATAFERSIEEMVAATVLELRIQTMVAAGVATIRAGFTPTPIATATPAPAEIATPTVASVTVRDPLLGVGIHPWKAGHSPTLEEINELGIGWVRFVAYADRLAGLGDVLANFDRFGVRVILVVNQETFPRKGDENFDNYANRFSSEFARLVSAHDQQVAAWEVWNEPDDPKPWKHLKEADYLLLLELCFKKAKALSPQTVVLATGYAGGVNLLRGENHVVVGKKVRCDGYVYHSYGERVGNFPAHYNGPMISSLTAAHAATGVPIWVTEFGAPLEDFEVLGGDAEEHQAEYLRRAVEEARGLSFVQTMIYFGFVDLDNEEKAQKYGLLTLGFEKRAAYQTFASLTGAR
ncbi:MAG: glycosyl hydrolase [bacterium]|nr:glycosyl hydrolase [bacterium]